MPGSFLSRLFAAYLEQLASTQYLLSRGHFWMEEGAAFFWGGGIPRVIAMFHMCALAFSFESLVRLYSFLQPIRGILLAVTCAAGLSVLIFLDSNSDYLRNLRERVRFDSPEAASARERAAWSLLWTSVVFFVLAVAALAYTGGAAA